ncbi:MAG: hypothetical protein AB8G23_07185 [Myxococcota bacterium]
MRFRLLAFFPLAAALALLFLASASSMVSAIEKAAGVGGQSEEVVWIPVNLFESECNALFREIHALSHEITMCGADPLCLGSPLFCPGALDSTIDREYERLRSELNERCDVPLNLMDYAWGGPAWGVPSRVDSSSRAADGEMRSASVPGGRQRLQSSPDSAQPNQCRAAHDWLESATSGTAEASRFFF